MQASPSKSKDNDCLKCKGIVDCPYIEVALDGSPSPPIDCPCYIERMKEIEKSKKKHSKEKLK